mmetsp:Transcript_11858/g.19312  ORF Transcript_11858/g.19312 Transcript_11858/m.19312 type:complete len:481 (-) Transcript_11858:272-1714(-)
MLHRFKESVLQTIGQKKSSYENKEFQGKVEKFNQFIRSVEQVHDSIVLYIEANDLVMSANLGVAESLCNFSINVRKADQSEGSTGAMNLVTLHFLKIQEDLAQLYKEQIRGLLREKCLRPLESILALAALVSEKEKIIKSSTLDCDHFKSKKESELLSGKLSDHPTVVKLNEQLKDAERVVATETAAVLNFFERVDAHMSTMLGPETSVLVGALQFSHSSSSRLLEQLNTTLPQSAATICELAARFAAEEHSLKSPRCLQDDAVSFPAVLSHVQFLDVDVFSPLQNSNISDDASRIISGTFPDLNLGENEKSGILKKKNKLFWEERWFELRKPGVLTWFKNSPDSPSLSGRGSVGAKEEARNHLNLFEVASIEYVPRSCNVSIEVDDRKTYELFAGDENLAAEWYEAMVPWLRTKKDAVQTPRGSSEERDSSVPPPPPLAPSKSSAKTTTPSTPMPSDGPPPPPPVPGLISSTSESQFTL